VRDSFRLLLLLALAVACGPGEKERPSTAADSARPESAQAAADSTRVASADTVATNAADTVRSDASGVDTLCAEPAAAAQRALAVAFTRDSGALFPSPRGTGPSWRGCRVRGTGSIRPYGAVASMPEPRIREAMRATNWVEDLAWEASGPEGSAFALRRGATLCHYDILFPGTPGDDVSEIDSVTPADTSGPPLPYIVHILCTAGVPPQET
jgi:hypothetical protein